VTRSFRPRYATFGSEDVLGPATVGPERRTLFGRVHSAPMRTQGTRGSGTERLSNDCMSNEWASRGILMVRPSVRRTLGHRQATSRSVHWSSGGLPCPPPGRREVAADDVRPPLGVRRTEQDAACVRSTPVDAVPRASRQAATPAIGRGRSLLRIVGAVTAVQVQPRPSRSIISAAAAEGLSATGIPKPARIACFSAADSPPGPSSFTIAPAWPICFPAGASKPAM